MSALKARWRFGSGPYAQMVAAAVILAGLSLLLPSTPSYDPWAWLVWGREIVHLKLSTIDGPTWKPLPVLFTTVFALFGKAQPNLWLWVARAGGAMAVMMVFRFAFRLTGQFNRALVASESTRVSRLAAPLLAGSIASFALVFSGGFLSDSALGYSEGLMTAVFLVGLEMHLLGRRRAAFALGFVAALDRPEIWLIWVPYGLWLLRDRDARRLVLPLFALVPVLWFLPEYWGSGELLRGVTRAQHPRATSAAFASCPFCSELTGQALPLVFFRLKVAAALGIVSSAIGLSMLRRGRERDIERARGWAPLLTLTAVGVFGVAWWILIAVLTQAGFSGNDRYLVLGAACVEIVGGVSFGWAAAQLGRGLSALGSRLRRPPPQGVAAGFAAVALGGCFLLVPNWLARQTISIPHTLRALHFDADLRADATAAVTAAGGPDRLLRCGPVMTGDFQVPMVAWILGTRTDQIEAPPGVGSPLPPPPGVILQARSSLRAPPLPSVSSWPGVSYALLTRERTLRVFERPCAR